MKIVKKIKWSRYRLDVAQRVGRGIALLFHDRGTRRVWLVSSTPLPHFTPGKDPVPILQEAGWAPGPVWTGGKSRPHGIRCPTVQPVVSRHTDWATRRTMKIEHTYYFYVVHTYTYITFLTQQCPLSSVWPQCRGSAAAAILSDSTSSGTSTSHSSFCCEVSRKWPEKNSLFPFYLLQKSEFVCSSHFNYSHLPLPVTLVSEVNGGKCSKVFCETGFSAICHLSHWSLRETGSRCFRKKG